MPHAVREQLEGVWILQGFGLSQKFARSIEKAQLHQSGGVQRDGGTQPRRADNLLGNEVILVEQFWT